MRNLAFKGLATALVLVVSIFAVAKRPPPKPVKAVTKDGIKYRAPREHMGFVEAWDVSSGELVWRRQIYVVKFTVGLERDVQDVFITRLQVKGNALLVRNEHGHRYELSLETLEVKVLNGRLVEQCQ